MPNYSYLAFSIFFVRFVWQRFCNLVYMIILVWFRNIFIICGFLRANRSRRLNGQMGLGYAKTFVTSGWRPAHANTFLVSWKRTKRSSSSQISQSDHSAAGEKSSDKGSPFHPVFEPLFQLNSSADYIKEDAPLTLSSWCPLYCSFGSRCCAYPIHLQRRSMKTILMSTSFVS